MEELNQFAENISNITTALRTANSKYKKNSKLQAASFASYSTPIFKETKFKRFIMTGPDNQWPNYLVNLMNNSPLHGKIIDKKTKLVAGEGWIAEDSEDKDQLSHINDFLRKNKLNRSLKRWALDQSLLGYWFIGITWNKTRTQIANIYHVDATTIRVGEPDEDGCIDHFWYSENWKDYRKTDFRPEMIERFDPTKRINENCLLMIRGYKPSMRFYNIPTYNGGRDAIELQIELTSYMLNSIKEGFAPTLNIAYNNGIPTDEEQQTIYNTVTNLFKGAKGQRFVLSFNNSKENATEITPINVSNMSDIYGRLGDVAEKQIIESHGTSPILCGIATTGKLGGAGSTNELEVSSEDYYNNEIEPAQSEIEEAIQDLLLINDWTIKVIIKPSKKLSSSYDSNTMLSVMTVDEIRQRMNMAPLSDNDKQNLAINITQPPTPTSPVKASSTNGQGIGKDAEAMESEVPILPVNDAVKNLSAKQHQQLIRIIRQYGKGQLTKEVASVLLKSSLGLSDDDIAKMLPDIEEEPEQMAVSIAPSVQKTYVNQVPKKKKENEH